MAIKTYSIRKVVEYKLLESDHLKYSVQYTHFGAGCQWSIHVSYRQRQEKWEVRRYNGPHSFLQTSTRQDHRRLDSKVIAQVIIIMMKANLTISIRVLQGSVETQFDYKASYRSTWVHLVTQPSCSEEDSVMFHKVLWIFSPCVETFKHCKPLISINGTHLYGKYGDTLFMAIAQDVNSNILPIVFGLVEGETKEAW
ncbi:hypothetical protein Ahy_B04g070852 isoform B [Arachis hypogaea]|uniref:Transposase MuDR plant domain-containing protein n=1 Tax=Arachis hypogaea TaxID=3818 RepID=A0A444ZJB6_ARAHY|nr:hypothetical protein Ahy_B04g070852 isoform B [Arachis hypogaea]